MGEQREVFAGFFGLLTGFGRVRIQNPIMRLSMLCLPSMSDCVACSRIVNSESPSCLIQRLIFFGSTGSAFLAFPASNTPSSDFVSIIHIWLPPDIRRSKAILEPSRDQSDIVNEPREMLVASPVSTGPLEGTNNKIKTMKRQAYGFRDQEFFKLKILGLHETRYALVG